MTGTAKVSVMILAVASLAGLALAAQPQVDHVLKQTKARQEMALRKNLKRTFPPKNAPGGPGLWHYENLALAAYSLNGRQLW